MKNRERIMSALLNEPWLIQASWLEKIIAGIGGRVIYSNNEDPDLVILRQSHSELCAILSNDQFRQKKYKKWTRSLKRVSFAIKKSKLIIRQNPMNNRISCSRIICVKYRRVWYWG